MGAGVSHGRCQAAASFCFVFDEAQDSLEKVICVILTRQQLISCYRRGEPDPSPGTGMWARRPLPCRNPEQEAVGETRDETVSGGSLGTPLQGLNVSEPLTVHRSRMWVPEPSGSSDTLRLFGSPPPNPQTLLVQLLVPRRGILDSPSYQQRAGP